MFWVDASKDEWMMPKRRKSPVMIETTEAHMCSLDLRLKILRTVPFFRSLSAAEFEKINLLFKEKGYEPGAFLYHSGDSGRQMFVVAEGRARLLRLTAGGKQVMLDLLIPGDFFGVLGQEGQPYPDSAQALTPVCALTINVEHFRGILQTHASVAMDILDTIASRLREAHDSIHFLSAETAEKRIAHILIKLGRKIGQPGNEGLLIQTPLGRDELAEMTGVTPETASRVISQFQKDGWIATGRQWVALKDQSALESILT